MHSIMMFMHIRRNLICISNNNSLSLSLLQSFSTSVEKQTCSAVLELLVHKHHLCPQSASQIASSFPALTEIEKYDSILSFLKESGFSNPQLNKLLKLRFLSASLDRVIKPKIRFFQDSGFSANDIAEIIANDPDILLRSLNNRLIPSLLSLKDLLGSSLEVAEILKISGYFLKCDLENTMVRNVEYLRSCGLAMDRIKWVMYHFPRCLMRKHESVIKFVERVDEIGIERSSKMFIHAIRILDSMTEETWEQKWKAFEKLGFSEDEIMTVCRKAPQLFYVSEEKMKKLKEVVLASGKYDVSCIVKYPRSLICSIEKRYKPRLKVLGILESNNLIKDWPSFSALHKMTDDAFFKKYVGPYLSTVGDLREIGSSFGGKG